MWISAPFCLVGFSPFNENHPYVLKNIHVFSLQMTRLTHFWHSEETFFHEYFLFLSLIFFLIKSPLLPFRFTWNSDSKKYFFHPCIHSSVTTLCIELITTPVHSSRLFPHFGQRIRLWCLILSTKTTHQCSSELGPD